MRDRGGIGEAVPCRHRSGAPPAWDAVTPTHVRYGLGETMPPEDLRDVIRFTQQHRIAAGPFDVALEGRTDGATPSRGAKRLAP
jgi:hypothetical protein